MLCESLLGCLLAESDLDLRCPERTGVEVGGLAERNGGVRGALESEPRTGVGGVAVMFGVRPGSPGDRTMELSEGLLPSPEPLIAIWGGDEGIGGTGGIELSEKFEPMDRGSDVVLPRVPGLCDDGWLGGR